MLYISNYYKHFESIKLHQLSKKQNDYCVIVGVLNNGQDFIRHLDSLQKHKDQVDIIIADGGSEDTSSSKESLKTKINTLLICENTTGLSHQYQAALDYALEKGYKGMIMTDGNGKDRLDAIPEFIKHLENDYGFIQGSRFMAEGGHENTPVLRYLGIKLVFTPIMRITSGFKYTDPINGFKAVNDKFLLDEHLQPFRKVFSSYSLQFYFNYRAPKTNCRVTEIPVFRSYPNRKNFPTKIKGFRGYLNILKLLTKVCFGNYNPVHKL